MWENVSTAAGTGKVICFCGTTRSEAGEQAGSMKLNCEWGFGAATHVTGAFGFAAAGEVVRRLAAGN